MSDILARLKQAHDSRNMTAVDVPEYADTWYFPAVTLADQTSIRRGVNLKSASAEQELMVNALIHLARTKDGVRVFDVPLSDIPALKAELHRMEAGVLMRIVMQANGRLSAGDAAEIASCDLAALRAALADVFGDEHPRLAVAAREVGDDGLRAMLAALLENKPGSQSAKNA